ncbi:glycosyltransferase family 4 protein [Rhodanobacter ginsengiterrae]|uniref:glycosyltransferase family 4 protein n=1 Tax=Rhodanobacter ginsengiterrae TaxID=2008451 RepID=UPI003CF1FAEF
MKFLLVGTNPEKSGAATHFVALAQALVEAGHEVSVATSPAGLIEQELAHADVHLYRATFRNALDLRGYVKVLAAARQAGPDWLIGNFGKEYWPLIVIGRLLRIPVALFRHRVPPMKRLSGYLLPRLAQRFFAVSNYARQSYLERGVPPQRVQLLYNPVNMALCQRDAGTRSDILRTLGIADDAIVLGYCGRIHHGKGIFPLFEAVTAAMEQQPRLHCLWLGSGPDAQTLMDRAAALAGGDRHHFPGWINNIHPYYSAMSMLAFPSIAAETFGRTSVEAQAAGIPVLVSNVGGAPETLKPGVTGLLLPAGDVDAWRTAILEMCDAARRLPMGVAAQEYVREHFSMSVIAAEFVRTLGAAAPVQARKSGIRRATSRRHLK